MTRTTLTLKPKVVKEPTLQQPIIQQKIQQLPAIQPLKL